MHIVSVQVFDDVITGTGTTWYSGAEFNRSIGGSEGIAIHAHTAAVSGTSPTLTVQAEHSADNQNWYPTPSAEINAVSIVSGGSYVGTRTISFVPLMSFIRLKITLGGTNPECRLKLEVTGRTRACACTG